LTDLKINILLLVLPLFFACNSSEQQTDRAETTSNISEEDLVTRLSMAMIVPPRDQEDKDRNAILNYAIDSLWNVQATNSGLYYEVIQSGEGDTIQWAERIEVHYEGFFPNGQKFDSSYDRKQTIKFYVGNMIDGWNEILQLVKPKSELRLLVPSRLAYGKEGLVSSKGDTIVPSNQVLAFKIKVLRKIK